MTKTLSMVSHKNYNLNANKGFVIFLTSILITTWFIGGFPLKMKSQSIAYLHNESEHTHWIWNLEVEVHSIWDLWESGLQKWKDNGFSKSDGRAAVFGRVQKILIFWTGGCLARIFRHQKVRGGELNFLHN